MDLIVILLIVLLLGGSGWGYHAGFYGAPGILLTVLLVILIVYLVRGRGNLPLIALLFTASLGLSGCTSAYESTVASRSVAGYAKAGAIGAKYTVTYGTPISR